MREITLEELLEAGCHFGHQVTRSNPKARDFIFEARDGIHIIDLAKTKEGLEEAAAFVKDLASKNGVLVVVGTKRQAQELVKEEVKRAHSASSGSADNLFYITNRWVGGLLTNFQEVSKNFKKYADFVTDLQDDEVKSRYTKKEIGGWAKESHKLENLYGGVAKITKKPDALFIIDSHLENLAVREALATHVPTVGLVDTNADPAIIDYPIPANDDAVGSVKLIISYIIDAWIEGRKEAAVAMKDEELRVKKEAEAAAKKQAASAKGSSEPKEKEAKKTVAKTEPKAPKAKAKTKKKS
ncbi:MAG: 30S ribosomal protein S2 [bacterium]|nr:30S ribosomal protein S2 [bacterium]